MKAAEFNQLTQYVKNMSPKQKYDLEKHLLDHKPQPQVIKFLEQALMVVHTASMMLSTDGARQKGAKDTAAGSVDKPTMHLLGPYKMACKKLKYGSNTAKPRWAPSHWVLQ